jgi:hypothetical protein
MSEEEVEKRPELRDWWPLKDDHVPDGTVHGAAMMWDAQKQFVESGRLEWMKVLLVGRSHTPNVYPEGDKPSLECKLLGALDSYALKLHTYFAQVTNTDRVYFPAMTESWMTGAYEAGSKKLTKIKPFGDISTYENQTNALSVTKEYTTEQLKEPQAQTELTEFYRGVVEEVGTWRFLLALSDKDLRSNHLARSVCVCNACEINEMMYSLFAELKKGLKKEDSNNVFNKISLEQLWDVLHEKSQRRFVCEGNIFFTRFFGRMVALTGVKRTQELFRMCGHPYNEEGQATYFANWIDDLAYGIVKKEKVVPSPNTRVAVSGKHEK